MRDSAARLRPWWRALRSRSGSRALFSVTCRCGQALHGERQRHHQVLPCPGCGRSVFVLPRTPFPDRPAVRPGTPSADGLSIPSSWSRFLKLRRVPLLAAVATLTILGVFFWVLLPYLGRPAPATDDPQARLEAGQRALEEGSFHRALEELTAAARARERRPDALTTETQRRLERLRRQAAILDGLLNASLEELLRQAVGLSRADEWRRHFETNYRGRTVLFDDEIGFDEKGRPTLRYYEVRAGQETARVALEDLNLMRELPLQPPQRVLFGARLARFARDVEGVWVIGLEPDSGVLLTDAEVLASWRPNLLTPDLRDLIRRQADWLRDRP